MHTVTYVLLRRAKAICVRQRHAARLQRRADTCITHNMHQTDLHLLGTAPPMPPSPLFCSPFPLTTSCSRLWPEGLRGRRGRPARTTRTAWQRAAPPRWSAKIGTSKQASAEHRVTLCMHARHAHIVMHSTKQHRKPGMRYRASIAWAQADFAMRSARVVQAAILPRWICAHK